MATTSCTADSGSTRRVANRRYGPETEALVGLHVDSWYRREFGLDRREQAPNHFCLNLGSQERFFVFVNVPVGQMFAMAKDESDISADTCGPTALAREFLRSCPSYPVVRVRIRPGEAYFAPTEAIIHDGSSIEMNATDIVLSVRGRFGLCAN